MCLLYHVGFQENVSAFPEARTCRIGAAAQAESRSSYQTESEIRSLNSKLQNTMSCNLSLNLKARASRAKTLYKFKMKILHRANSVPISSAFLRFRFATLLFALQSSWEPQEPQFVAENKEEDWIKRRKHEGGKLKMRQIRKITNNMYLRIDKVNSTT